VAFTDERTLRIVLVGALVLRVAAAAMLPLAFDEAYYWRWSQHLSAGYWDHPPMIAFVIRAGTTILGDSLLGVRAGALLLSFAVTWAVWRSGEILLGGRRAGLLAAVIFNLTLMISIQTLVATPDAPSVAASAFFVFFLAKAAQTGRGAWWLAAGAAGGFALLSKYTGLFLGAGAVLWLIMTPKERHWLRSPWPYAGAVLALLMFLPNILWNAEHDWISFTRQFGRAAGAGFTLRFLGEFLAAQIALATPFILVLMIAGLIRPLRRSSGESSPLALLLWLSVPTIAYFLWHSLHDRVQGNWPSFLYPALAVAAAAAWDSRGAVLRFSRMFALPVALALTLIAYLQAFTGVIPLARDPLNRLLAYGHEFVAAQVYAWSAQSGARAVLTTGYAQTGWLSYYLPDDLPVIQLNERERWLAEPPPDAELLQGPLLYVTESWRDRRDLVAQQFAEMEELARVPRVRAGQPIEDYVIYRVAGRRPSP
jgi:4-amino-4-deoxy-L-arabinose transferase-like glycosyltransferase